MGELVAVHAPRPEDRTGRPTLWHRHFGQQQRGTLGVVVRLGDGCLLGNGQLVGLRGAQIAVLAQELIERVLNLFLHDLRTTVAHVGVLGTGLDYFDTGLRAFLVIRHDAGIGHEIRILRPERKDLELRLGEERHAQVIQRHHALDHLRMLFRKEHRDIAAVGMADHHQLVVVGIGHALLHFADSKHDVGDAALVHRQPAHVEFADLGHQRRIGLEIVLNAQHQIAAQREHVGEERVFGILDGVAVIDDRDRQRLHAGHCPHF